MQNQKRIIRVLNQVLIDDSTPIQASINWASRDKSIATGMGGIHLALNEFSSMFRNYRLEFTEIFGAEIEIGESLVKIRDPNISRGGIENYSGDIFEGASSLIWSGLVAGKKVEIPHYKKTPGKVVRPGIGHGDSIREFLDWYQDFMSGGMAHFSVTESVPNQGGWCNGMAGKISLEITAEILAGRGINDPRRRITEVRNLIDWSVEVVNTAEYGLCHGTTGALVVAAGVARLLGDTATQRFCNFAMNEIKNSEALVAFPDDLLLDYSWLTGLAGYLWALKAVVSVPHINPLLPFDSLKW